MPISATERRVAASICLERRVSSSTKCEATSCCPLLQETGILQNFMRHGQSGLECNELSVVPVSTAVRK